ncbi:hypothetical protein M406DRAFT_257023 [Cryphonectria parasitica EP155]|uniref:Guanine nucleotide exchange factor LTE1 n=1 Tax=Cryphonectria parasitica (strain ATCC 38755 / EP155) TaxID=660469 RepID=A0A9P4Y4L8_CRYP1|nr:uncharacterized protein M406DRAFT_257023 [Cryphonectria parasitica EP155]KAF3766272.1 hypothetical protein M406DRAFT_257023 [Cryphonectria parasitica EP155]
MPAAPANPSSIAPRDTVNTRTRPLLPVAERRNPELDAALKRPRTNSETERWDITPDGGSGGREGRRFAVSNVGNNGRIYLRPTVRPAHERHQAPSFVFPMTPPQTAGLGSKGNEQSRRPDLLDVGKSHDLEWTLSQGPATPTNQPLQTLLLSDRSGQTPAHRRAMSDSTIQDASVARESDAGGFKIVITKPGNESRSKTLEDIDPRDPPFLEILIPSWKLGTPRWSTRGTPFLRGSSYAPTEEFRSSHPSPLPPRFGPGSIRIPSARLSSSLRSPFITSVRLSPEHALRSTYMSTHQAIEPAMFDALTFKPACDDRALVRYSPSTTAVTAATPPRLVAEITSPTFLDYELLSDFFLTFRSYLAPLDLLKMLFARMRWSLARNDEIGTVVRVRTFVALRHWILNYFVDDFVCEYDVRVKFCILMNGLAEEMAQCAKARRVQLKILAELKKCWRRVCAQFWDGSEFDANLPPEAPITPGGIPGHRDPSLDPSLLEEYSLDGPPQLETIYAPLTSNPPDVETSFYREVAEAGGNDYGHAQVRSRTPSNEMGEKILRQNAQFSPTSMSSVDALSCSIPLKFGAPRSNHPLAAHPVDPSALYTDSEPVAPTPRALAGKRARAQHSHKRNKSTSDSLRERDPILERLLQRNTETTLSLPYAGSLVRGNVLPPGQAFVEVLAPNSVGGPSRQTTYLRLETNEAAKDKFPPSAMSGQGMRRLIGSVRRALTSRGQEMSPTQGNFNITPIGPRGVTANRLPGTAIVPQSRTRTNNFRPPVRIDLLGAEIVEDFKRVVREDAAEAAARTFHGSTPSTPTTIRNPVGLVEHDTTRIESLLGVRYGDEDRRPTSEGGVTAGSKSILIFDGTRASSGHPAMSGAIPVLTPSVEAFADSFMPSGADPTPPNTPPGRITDTPRRSSQLLGQHMLRSAKSADNLPPFIPDLESLDDDSSLRRGENYERPSVYPRRRSSNSFSQSQSRPPLSGVSRFSRQRYSRSLFSNGTMGPRRRASFHSGMDHRSTLRSFDAVSDSNRLSEQSSEVAMPHPLRLLRRRPGGDLRAVNNVVDLGHAQLRRSRSLGSLTTGTYTPSLGTSLIQSPNMARDSTGLLDMVNSASSRDRTQAFSVGMMADRSKRRQSLLSTLSSKPVMRPSFEVEAQRLANIPDDDDDGGVESALLKLEGKYQKKVFRLSMEPTKSPLREFENADDLSQKASDNTELKAEKKKHRNEHIGDEGVSPFPPSDGDVSPVSSNRLLSQPGPGNSPSAREPRVEVISLLSEGSNASLASIPLLQRRLTDDERRSRAVWADRSILGDAADGGASTVDEGEAAQDCASYEVVKRSESIEKIKPGDTMPTRQRSSTRVSQMSQQFFLNIGDTDDDDELSSEMSEMPLEEDEDIIAFPSLQPGVSLSKIRTSEDPSQPMEDDWLSSPAMAPDVPMASHVDNIPELHTAQIWGVKPLPPTPECTPTFTQPAANPKPSPDSAGVTEAPRIATNAQERDANARRYSAHLPFILAFDSEVLAQQFTLIEKDALNEIDWKELIDMRWKNAENNDARSWVQFLRDTDARGVEVVIARFNIVVKWAISEIVLTQDIEERARCIIKYIHIAAHCRRYRNFATMSQIAIALTSTEVSRLAKTWDLVPAGDTRALHELEALISPTRNFYALRAEMEGGGLASAGMGCIPFVGIYTHDLIFNSQRPAEIASSPTTAPLVNFERCRIAAGIVKALLRLLEASTLYNFQPIEGITERCLWMSALTDEEIRRHSQGLE